MPLGQVRKMRAQQGDPIQYSLKLGEESVVINDFLGKEIRLKFRDEIRCVSCGSKTKKSFGQGFCYKCFISAPEASECIIRPERCKAHLGQGRDPQWEEEHHNQPHVVYLAVSNAIKVGVTRDTQVPTRWIDQGATQAVKVAETPYRQLAGEIEVALKNFFTDRTNWRRMLTNQVLDGVDLVEEKWLLEEKLPSDLRQYMTEDDEVFELHYPVLQFPEKVKSIGFDKYPEIHGELLGIKGQYLLLNDDRVLNIRKHNGYVIELS